jgi:hypothetical protein
MVLDDASQVPPMGSCKLLENEASIDVSHPGGDGLSSL